VFLFEKVLAMTPSLYMIWAVACITQATALNPQHAYSMSQTQVSKAHIAREINLTEELKERFLSKVGPVQENGCALWQAGTFQNGYGCFAIEQKAFKANRVAFLIYNGYLPVDLMVLHKCDNPLCVSRTCLFLGTHQDNMADKSNKGRQAKGETHGSRTKPERLARGERHGFVKHPELIKRGDDHWSRQHPEWVKRGDDHPLRRDPSLASQGETHHKSKLTADQVREIRSKYDAGGISQMTLSGQYGVRQDVISDIVRRKTWKSVI
jgi:hypothetical protein